MTPNTPDCPVVCAWGGGVDSTAMLVELVETGQRVDMVLFADPGGETEATYSFIDLFTEWLVERGVPVEVVRYVPTRFKNQPSYADLYENCITNGTLPSVVFGGGTCSLKWKVAPQDKWTAEWPAAKACWDAGGKVVRLIGYDCSPADNRRYAHSQTLPVDPRFSFRYPLREWGWNRADCEARIRRAGLPVPPKSSCFYCGAMTPAEVRALSKVKLRRIVLMEARAKPRLRNVDGLWRKPVLGRRGAIPKPGSMTQFIREQGLLPEREINAIIAAAPTELLRWHDATASNPDRPAIREWLELFDRTFELGLDTPGERPLFAHSSLRQAAKAPETP